MSLFSQAGMQADERSRAYRDSHALLVVREEVGRGDEPASERKTDYSERRRTCRAFVQDHWTPKELAECYAWASIGAFAVGWLPRRVGVQRVCDGPCSHGFV